MKKFLTIIAAAALCCSCNFLDVPLESSISTSNYYKTTADFNMSLTGVYNVLLDATNTNRYGTYFQGLLVLGRVGTDEMVTAFDNGYGEAAVGDYTYTPSTYYVSRPWAMFYKGIQKANVIIDRLTPMSLDMSEKNRILGETYFLRSFFYFHLVRLYGEVPLVVNEVSDVSKMDMTKHSIAEVYALIVSDLENAVELLPASNANGRPSSYAAKTMLAKVYLQMAGNPLQDNTAAAHSKSLLMDVINNGPYDLEENYLELFDGRHEYGSEYIWDIEFTNNGTTTYGGCVGTLEGPMNPASLYWTMLRAPQEYYETFEENDLRKDAIARYALVYDENKQLVPQYYWQTEAIQSMFPEIKSYEDYKAKVKELQELGVLDYDPDWYYFAYKFRHPLTKEERGAGWANWANPINFPILRYADVLLMYAEAELRADGSVGADGLEYLNQVRRRGFGVDIHTANPGVDVSKADYEFILMERSHELCFEGQRWYDLVRFGKLEEKVKTLCKYPMTLSYTRQAETFREKHNFYPIPQDVIDASNGAIEQNALWK